MERLAVIVCCFNRKALTLAGLATLFGQQPAEGVTFTVYLVDDASSDGTAEAVMERFPAVTVLHGDGGLWWAGAMRLGLATAMAVGYDGYIWWNDDTLLDVDALRRLLACSSEATEELGPVIVAGTTRDSMSGVATFGGYRREISGLQVRFLPVEPDAAAWLRCDTMNGNFTLIPDAIARAMGNMEPGFRHQLADFDYGLRATKAGFAVVTAPGTFGTCSRNPAAKTWRDGETSLAGRWKNLMSPKGAPPSEWLLYTTRHFGWRWPLYFVSPYIKVLFKGVTARS